MSDILFQRLCTIEALYRAWQHIKEKNTSGGIDKKTVDDYAVGIDNNLANLLNSLVEGKYVQQPYKEIFIDKNASEKRRLGLLTVNDKIVQTAVSQTITPIFEQHFLKVSYGYRVHLGPVKAIHKVNHLITQEKYSWVAFCDIDNFFDTIPHDLLFKRVTSFLNSPGIIELLKMFVKMGRVNKHMSWKDSKCGVPQGGVVSPILANFYLHPLDKLMVDNNYGFVRYADDFVILGKSETEAKSALSKAIEFITNHLQLTLNTGSEVIPVTDGFEFLGILFKDKQLSMSEAKYNRLVAKLNSASHIGNEFITKKLRDVMHGIRIFYCKLVPQEILSNLDDQLINILNTRIAELHVGKNRQRELINQIRQLEFFCNKHNFQRADYVKKMFIDNINTKSPIKTKKPNLTPIKSDKAVTKRKQEYQKIESEGFDLVLSTQGLFVGRRENRLIVKKKGIIIQEVKLINLKNITILSDGISFSSNVIEACAEYKVSIDFLKRDGLPYAMVHSPVFFEAKTGIGQLEAYKNEKCYHLVKKFVWGKIINQSNLVKYYGKYYQKRNTDFSKEFKQTIDSLKKYSISALNLNRADLDTFRQSMFGIEGQASLCYWEAMSHIVNIHIPFATRQRQGATDLVNCMLNYGYGILYSRVSEAIIRARLNPNLSYLHKPENNRPSLVYDLIEEFRQQTVDRVIFAIITKCKNLNVTDGQLDERTKKFVATKIIERLNTVEIFRRREMRLFEIINFQACSVALYLEGEINIYKPYIKKW